MTTIAYSKSLATVSCDLLVNHQNIKFFCETKFFVSNYFLLASAGCVGEREAIGQALLSRCESSHNNGFIYEVFELARFEKEKIDGSHLLFAREGISKSGEWGGAYIYASGGFIRLEEHIKALGSGLEFATSFMTLKPEEPTSSAVHFASTFDVYTGEKTKTFDLVKWEYI